MQKKRTTQHDKRRAIMKTNDTFVFTALPFNLKLKVNRTVTSLFRLEAILIDVTSTLRWQNEKFRMLRYRQMQSILSDIDWWKCFASAQCHIQFILLCSSLFPTYFCLTLTIPFSFSQWQTYRVNVAYTIHANIQMKIASNNNNSLEDKNSWHLVQPNSRRNQKSNV